MVRGPCHFRQRDLTAALKAAKAADVAVNIEIGPDGKMTVKTKDSSKRVCGRADNGNEWDEVFDGDDGDDQT
jgi:hypothetical protein